MLKNTLAEIRRNLDTIERLDQRDPKGEAFKLRSSLRAVLEEGREKIAFVAEISQRRLDRGDH